MDPGAQAEKIAAVCDRLGVQPEAILLTHGHFDHIMAVDALRRQYDIPVYAGAQEAEVLSSSVKNLSGIWASAFTVSADRFLKDREQIEIAGMQLCVISTPGHTPGGVCYYAKVQGVLFSGDTLFRDSYGRTDFPGGSTAALFTSIRNRLLPLPEETVVYPGHGSETDIGYEKKYNPAG